MRGVTIKIADIDQRTRTRFADMSSRACHKCNVIKYITDFDLKKPYVRNVILSKIKCEYCSSIIDFSGLKSHFKRFQP